jgi:hypothetical protein
MWPEEARTDYYGCVLRTWTLMNIRANEGERAYFTRGIHVVESRLFRRRI